jgi:poly-beta-1,6-N-acetyl-D-glucosamine synthase
MTWALLILTFVYSAWVFSCRSYWQKLPVLLPGDEAQLPQISVIVPVRNEEKNIRDLLSDLSRQNYPAHKFEVLIIDDGSEDKTTEIVANFAQNSSIAVSLLSLNNENYSSPKKAAISFAIKKANGDIVISTDGDCRVGEDWLRYMVIPFESDKTHMVSGPVAFHCNGGLFNEWQILEFASLIGVGAASIAAGKPNMCNGANLAYRKSAFEAVGGFEGNEKLASGDDEFLMHKISRAFSDSVSFAKHEKAVVFTHPHSGLKSFFYQRKRWASKWAFYSNPGAIQLAVSVFIFHLIWVLAFALFLVGQLESDMFLAALVLRIFSNALFIQEVLGLFGQRFKWTYHIFLELIYSFYVVLFGIGSNFGHYEWKGRKLN